jgi:hypothetical protein
MPQYPPYNSIWRQSSSITSLPCPSSCTNGCLFLAKLMLLFWLEYAYLPRHYFCASYTPPDMGIALCPPMLLSSSNGKHTPYSVKHANPPPEPLLQEPHLHHAITVTTPDAQAVERLKRLVGSDCETRKGLD